MKGALKKFISGAIVLSLATIAGYLISPIEVRFLETLTTSTFLIGLTYGIGALLFAILAVWLGRLSDIYGRKKFVVIGALLGIVYPLLYASTLNIFQYMGVRLPWAFSAVAMGPLLYAYLQDQLKKLKHQGQAMGIVYSTQALFGAGAALLGGFLAERYGLTAPYLLMAVFFVFISILAGILLESSKPKKQTKKEKHKGILFGLRYLFSKPQLVFYFILNAGFGVNWGLKIMLWPLIIFGFSGRDTITGSVFATMGIVAFFLLPFAGRFVDKINPFIAGKIELIILGASGLVLALTHNLIIFWIAAGFYAIGEAINGPVQAVLLTNFVPTKHRGEILGFDAVIDMILNFSAPFLAGILLAIFSAQMVLLAFILLIWVSLSGVLLIKKSTLSLKSV